MYLGKISTLLFISIAIIFTACEDPIDIELDEGTPQLNVDAFINNKSGEQSIRLLKTTNYFDNESLNAISTAEVKVGDNLGNEWLFTHYENGVYTNSNTDTIVKVGRSYVLQVVYQGDTFRALSSAMPTTEVDSINFIEQTGSGPGTLNGFIGEFWGRDIPNMPNYYWIKAYRNDTFISDPNFINLAFDAAQGQGAGSDGLAFIPPVRTGITTFPNIYQKGDSVRVEIHGIDAATFQFITQAQSQITNGGLFATPPFNVITNIVNTSGSEAIEDQAVGWFSVATVASGEAVAGAD